MRIIIIALSIFCFVVLYGCEFSQSTNPYFEIIEKSDGMTDSGMYYIDLVVKNTGSSSGKNVICKITVKDMDSQKVYTTTSTIFNEGRNIVSGSSAKSRAIFTESGFLELKENNLFYFYELSWEES